MTVAIEYMRGVRRVAIDYLRGVRREPGDWVKAILILMAGLPLVAAGVAALTFFATFYMFRPDISIPPPQPGALAETSTIFAGDGSLIASFHAEHNRELIPLAQMPRHLRQAVLSVEDARFYEHKGVDFKSVVRAFTANLGAGRTTQGGSTITQQYVKQAYVGTKRTLFRKLREARIAVQLERELSKDQILERYLNTVYFGQGAYGVEAAAKTYFDKPASQVDLSEAALLAGLIQSPGSLSPLTHPSAADARRREVLTRMELYRFVQPAVAEKAMAVKPTIVKPKLGAEILRYPWFVDAVRRYILNRYGEEAVFAGGLKVYTTIDPAMQEAAEEAVRKGLPNASDPYGALASIDPATGYVRALVGGRDFEQEKFNIAIQGPRQPGSSFKPFVLVAALENGITPGDHFNGPSEICLKAWIPDCRVHNFDNEGFGSISVTEATVHSVNTVFAQMVLQVGPGKVVDAAHRMGINGDVEQSLGVKVPQIDPVPALALGSEEVTPLEMASAYATLAARGVWHEPKFVSRVTDRKGTVLEEGPPPAVQALSQPVADTATEILTQVIQRGTGTRAAIGRPAAGKTGTASDFQNAWFVGYTPDLATAIWMGYKDANHEMHNLHGFANVVGGSIPAQMWSVYMKQALLHTTPTEFAPAGTIASGRFRLPSDLIPTCPPPLPAVPLEPESPVPSASLSPTGSPFSEPGYSPQPFPTSPPLPFPSPSPLALRAQQESPGTTVEPSPQATAPDESSDPSRGWYWDPGPDQSWGPGPDSYWDPGPDQSQAPAPGSQAPAPGGSRAPAPGESQAPAPAESQGPATSQSQGPAPRPQIT
ncbi:MAG TPA: PBP1A family penicillin-binding protein, partial [Actinomycetota bacterium]